MANTSSLLHLVPISSDPIKHCSSPQMEGETPALAALPCCVFGSALSSLQPWHHPQAMLTPFLQPFSDLLQLPCSSWNASTNLSLKTKEKGSSNTTRLLFKLLICYFIEAAEEKTSPPLFCSHSTPTVQHPHKLCFCDPSSTQVLPPVSLVTWFMFSCGICWFNNPVGSACSCHIFLFQHKSPILQISHRFTQISKTYW